MSKKRKVTKDQKYWEQRRAATLEELRFIEKCKERVEKRLQSYDQYLFQKYGKTQE